MNEPKGMRKIYSKVDPAILLHIVCKKELVFDGPRMDIVPAHEFIQLASLDLTKGKKFKAHKHQLKVNPQYSRAQESWVVLSGKVKAILYDIDDTIIEEVILTGGDCTVTLAGGHNYEIIEDAKVYEFKTGPYLGHDNDKSMIE